MECMIIIYTHCYCYLGKKILALIPTSKPIADTTGDGESGRPASRARTLWRRESGRPASQARTLQATGSQVDQQAERGHYDDGSQVDQQAKRGHYRRRGVRSSADTIYDDGESGRPASRARTLYMTTGSQVERVYVLATGHTSAGNTKVWRQWSFVNDVVSLSLCCCAFRRTLLAANER